jgi:RNase P subunit RPR2|tara:strand:- start:1064 stop:1324 length:261 start_codon:yes stop_codon:yes gene_type:complete
MKKLTKQETEKQIKEFFSNVKNKSPKDVKKIKKIAMSNNIPLKNLRKFFCKKCYVVFNKDNSKIRIKNSKKTITCLDCNYISRWKL